jgi:hypothetical protein
VKTSVFSNAPKGLVGTTTILPVKLVLKASIADRAVSESPRMTKTLGSITIFYMSSFFAKAGTCSGITSFTFYSLYFIWKEARFLIDGP